MNLPTCRHCERPVLELTGQFEKFDSYFAAPGVDLTQAGWWHARCRATIPGGAAWTLAKVANFIDVRGCRQVAATEVWTVLEFPNTHQRIALAQDGRTLSLPRIEDLRTGAHGHYYEVTEDYNLGFEDTTVVQLVQSHLRTQGRFPIIELATLLSIADTILHPDLMTDAAFIFDDDLMETWSPVHVSAIARYPVHVPQDLVASAC